jgi:hypothetical protein
MSAWVAFGSGLLLLSFISAGAITGELRFGVTEVKGCDSEIHIYMYILMSVSHRKMRLGNRRGIFCDGSCSDARRRSLAA